MNYFIEQYAQNSVVFICQIIWAILLLLIQYNCRDNENNKILKVWVLILTIILNLFPYIGIMYDFVTSCITIYFMMISKSMGNSYSWAFRKNSKFIQFLMKDI